MRFIYRKTKHPKWKWELIEYYHHKICIKGEEVNHKYFTLSKEGKIILKCGYAIDGLTGAIDTNNAMRAAFVHDMGCQAINEGLLHHKYRKVFDDEFRIICLKDGVSSIRALWMWLAIRGYAKWKFGWSY